MARGLGSPGIWLAAALVLGTATPAAAQFGGSPNWATLRTMSLAQLAALNVTSTTKSAVPVIDAPADFYVITGADIVHAGAMSLPQALRLAPTLEVDQIAADQFAVAARGFNGNAANKMLVMIDGRSIYTPLFGGVYWDQYDVLPQDIARIEVISGPGSTLWGANAMNGVINIITRDAAETQGGTLTLSAGSQENSGSLQYGGTLDPDLSYRTYLSGFTIGHDRMSNGTVANDGWTKVQGGLRTDWTPTAADHVTLEGDLWSATEGYPATVRSDLSGGNVQVNWARALAGGGNMQLLAYYDRVRDMQNAGGGGYAIDTYDLEFQNNVPLNDQNGLVWGAGERLYNDRMNFHGPATYVPPRTTTSVTDLFAQDTYAFTPHIKLIGGLKFEDDPYSGWSLLPDMRLSWRLNPAIFLWAAASRAIRAPTRFDTSLHDVLVPGIVVLNGNPHYRAETSNTYQLGTRLMLFKKVLLSATTYYSSYDHLRTVEVTRQAGLPILWYWGNLMRAESYGLDVFGRYQVSDRWTLKAGVLLEHQNRRFAPSSSRLGGIEIAGNDPDHQESLQSLFNITPKLLWVADLRYVGRLPAPYVPGYFELNSSLTWRLSDRFELQLTGQNLLHAHHLEYEASGAVIGTQVDRNVVLRLRWHF